MTKDEARKELLETLEEYCHDHGYGLQTFAGLSDLVYTLYPLQKHMTNADKIRGMNDEQLADWIMRYVEPCRLCAYHTTRGGCAGSINDGCESGRLAWLQREVKGNDK
jgi:hypothetical protein